MKTYIKETYNSYTEDGVPHELALEYTISDVYQKLCSEGVMTEDLRKWFGKGKTGSSGGGGWDRYGSDGQKLGKCGDGKKGGAYAACLSKEKAAKLGPKGRFSHSLEEREPHRKKVETQRRVETEPKVKLQHIPKQGHNMIKLSDLLKEDYYKTASDARRCCKKVRREKRIRD